MDAANLHSDLRLTGQDSGESVIIEGELREDNAAEFASCLRAIRARRGEALALDLSGVDIQDGVALASAINSLRELRGRVGRLTLKGAPQMLCHNLYRIGMLEGDGAIELVEMRLDEPSGF